MNFEAAKLEVVQKILGITKESLLEKISDLLDREMVVGYTVEGEPLTKESYNQRLEKAEQQIRSGEYLTQEDLEKESENW
ncbi:MAG: hypothetical protein JJU28_14445 [Cyclobacteriaceae bacterium]|nr:hypothetical protein [Cyclobacteriaceae bacterium]